MHMDKTNANQLKSTVCIMHSCQCAGNDESICFQRSKALLHCCSRAHVRRPFVRQLLCPCASEPVAQLLCSFA